ncbi:hypothetical protein UPYG_G00044430 [Umbra pygmaea]|uniref:Uncharacterized protein n=1 Tax=Umbra pygmaea TaxID=75934 RepID=A0ABD0Y9F0_UMBPY
MMDNTSSPDVVEGGKKQHVQQWLESSPTGLLETDKQQHEDVAGKSIPCLLNEDLVTRESPGCMSIKSDQSMGQPINLERGHGASVKRDRARSPTLSLASMRSDRSKDQPINYKLSNRREGSDSPSYLSMKSGQSEDLSLRMKTSDPTELSIGCFDVKECVCKF